MAIQLLSLSFSSSLSFSRPLPCFCPLTLPVSIHLHSPPPSSSLPLSPRFLKSNTRSHINFDQSKALICLAEETVTYWCRFSYTEMKKARRPESQNISVLTQTFTPHFIFSHSLAQKSQIYRKRFLPAALTYCPLWSRQMWEGRIYNDNYSWNQSLYLLSH